MPQKPLAKGKKAASKPQAANKHGKGDRIAVKGKLQKPPKKGKLLETYVENKELTKIINAKNEGNLAAKAETSGGRLKTLKAGPPVLAPNKGKGTSGKGAGNKDTAMDQD